VSVAEQQQPAARKRRTPLIVLAVIVVLVVIAAIVLDGVARSYAQNLIETKVRSALSLPASTPVDVTVGGTSVLLQLASGALEQVDVSVPQLAVGDLSGAADLSVKGVPIDTSKPIDSANVAFTIDQAGVQKLLKSFSGVPVSSATIRNGAVRLTGDVSLFGLKIPITVVEKPSAINGKLGLTPSAFEVNGASFTPATLTKTFGSLGETLSKTQQLCIASALPKAFTLDRVSVVGKSVRLVVSAKSVVLNDQLFSVKGVCP
jgi:hypothetical protein